MAPAPTLSLLCTVRGCRKPLERAGRRLVCGNDHSFDVARSGYVNLLQPQDRRSPRPGDSPEALAARHRVLEGVEAPLVAAIVDTLSLTQHDVVLDVGCGEGHHLGAIARRFGCRAHGLDISVPAIDAAARRHRGLEWVVANADRFVPYAERSFSVIASITGRKNAGEFRRVVRPDGVLLVVVPAADDLIEVRRAVLGEGVLHDRIERTVATFAPLFALERHERLRRMAHLDGAALADVMAGSYRGLRRSEHARLAAVGSLDVTLSRDVLLLRPERSALH